MRIGNFFIDPYDQATQRLKNYQPKDPFSADELFSMIKPLGVTEIVVGKNSCYIKIPSLGYMVPPDIVAYFDKFNIRVTCGSGRGPSAPYYANACRHSVRKIS